MKVSELVIYSNTLRILDLVLHKVGQETVQTIRLSEERWHFTFASSGFLCEDPQMLDSATLVYVCRCILFSWGTFFNPETLVLPQQVD